jgi:hypothetical protein
MEFKTTFTKTTAAAFSLVELCFAIAITTLALAAMSTFVLYSGKSFAAVVNYVDLEQKSQVAIDTMSREIRQVTGLAYYSTNTLIFTNIDGTPLTYSWSPLSRSLMRIAGDQKKVLLNDCDFLNFEIWQRSPISGVWSNYPATTINNAKLVNVSWKCSRKILGATLNTESVQTAKIVIRNN